MLRTVTIRDVLVHLEFCDMRERERERECRGQAVERLDAAVGYRGHGV